MSKELNLEELVSSYLDGDMSKLDRLSFENRLLQDPELREEYLLQKETLEQIKEYRRIELKSRLSNIKINAPAFYQSGLFKIAASIGTAAIVGAGIYFYGNDQKEEFSEVNLAQEQQIVVDEPVPEIPKVVIDAVEMDEVDALTETGEDQDQSVTTIAKKEEVKTKTPKRIKPDVVEPNVFSDIKEEEALKNEPAFKVTTAEKITDKIEKTVEVEVIESASRKQNLQYKFYNRKLFLYGDFNKEPYRIIELKGNKSKEYFLYYEGSYFNLKEDTFDPIELEIIENTRLIRKLDTIRLKN